MLSWGETIHLSRKFEILQITIGVTTMFRLVGAHWWWRLYSLKVWETNERREVQERNPSFNDLRGKLSALTIYRFYQ